MALQVDPDYDDAMAYENLLIRERADLDDNKEEYEKGYQDRQRLGRQAMAVKKKKQEAKQKTPRHRPPNRNSFLLPELQFAGSRPLGIGSPFVYERAVRHRFGGIGAAATAPSPCALWAGLCNSMRTDSELRA